MQIALVHDWLVRPGGGERVVWAMHQAFPEAPVYTSVYDADGLPEFRDCDVHTSFLQRWPLRRLGHQFFPSLRSMVFEALDLDEYDVVISSGTAEGKGVLTGAGTLHVSYIHTPTRYYWSDYHGYRAEPGFGRLDPIVRAVMPFAVRRRRMWDFAAAQRPDRLLTNSLNVAARIEKYYRRHVDAIIHPPIDVDGFTLATGPRHGFVTVSRLIPYKRVDLALEACRQLGRPLTVIGDGSELRRLRRLAGPDTRFLGTVDDATLAGELQRAEALLFPGEEDFGMVPLEAMACGTPVIAYGRGGALESVVDGKTGVFFETQSADALVDAIERFREVEFDPGVLRAHAEHFSTAHFVKALRDFVASEYASFGNPTADPPR